MRTIKIALMAMAAVAALAVTAYADALDRPDFDTSSVLVITKPSYGLFKLQSTNNDSAVFDELGFTEVKHVASLPAMGNKSGFSLFSASAVGEKEILKLSLSEPGEENVLLAVDKLNESGAVSVAQPNYLYQLDDGFQVASVPNDQFYEGFQDSLRVVGAEEVWDYNINCSNVKIGILDSGLMREHEDLADNIWENPGEIPGNGVDDDGNGYIDDAHGWDFTTASSNNNDPTNPVDPYYTPCLQKKQGHGTHVAGIADAVTNNECGIASLAGNAKLIGIRVYDDRGGSSSEYISAGLVYAGIIGCDIANCSWGAYGNDYDTIMLEAINSCPDTLFVCAAGNDQKCVDASPWLIRPGTLCLDNTMCIASSAADDTLSYFSNYGTTNIDLAAPGENAPGEEIYSTGNAYYSPSSYMEFMGTSQAAPLVSSAAAVLKARHPSLTPKDLKKYLIAGCDTPSTLTYTDTNKYVRRVTGNRRLNAAYSIYLADMDLLDTVETPVISVEQLEEGGKEIAISCGTSGADIYYTTDGSEPTKSSVPYTEPFVVEKNTRIWAAAFKDLMNSSDIARANITFPTVSTPVISVEEAADGYLVTLECETEGAEIYYSTDDTLDTEPIPYSAPFIIDELVTVKAQAYKQYFNDSEVAEYTPVKTKTPLITVTDMDSGQKQAVITSETDGADIYFTTDGTVPTDNSSKYTAPVVISEDTVLKAVAFKQGYLKSDVISEDILMPYVKPPVIRVTETMSGQKFATITCDTDGAQIYYTLDGTEPTDESTLYIAPFILEQDCVIKSFALKQYMNDSAVATNNTELKKVETPEITLQDEYGGVIVSLTCPTENAKIYYSLSDSADAELMLYNGKFFISSDTALNVVAKKEFMNDSEIVSRSISVPQLSAPTADVPGGSVQIGTSVTLSSDTDEAEIYYTLDGSEPTVASARYINSIVITDAITIKAIAAKKGYITSDVITYQYLPTDVDIIKNTVTLKDGNGTNIDIGDTPTEINARVIFDYAGIDFDDSKKAGLENLRFIIAVYTDGNRLAGIMNMTPDLDTLSPLEAKLTLDGSTRVSKVNMLYWNGLNNMKPLRDTKTIIE